MTTLRKQNTSLLAKRLLICQASEPHIDLHGVASPFSPQFAFPWAAVENFLLPCPVVFLLNSNKTVYKYVEITSFGVFLPQNKLKSLA